MTQKEPNRISRNKKYNLQINELFIRLDVTYEIAFELEDQNIIQKIAHRNKEFENMEERLRNIEDRERRSNTCQVGVSKSKRFWEW